MARKKVERVNGNHEKKNTKLNFPINDWEGGKDEIKLINPPHHTAPMVSNAINGPNWAKTWLTMEGISYLFIPSALDKRTISLKKDTKQFVSNQHSHGTKNIYL